MEVDFIAAKADEKKYIQVTESMNALETRERELAPLRKIRDSYEKVVIALECDLTQTQDGLKLLERWISYWSDRLFGHIQISFLHINCTGYMQKRNFLYRYKGMIRIPYGKFDTDLIKKIAEWCRDTGNHA